MAAPFLSIVVPCFNVVEKCERLLRSLEDAPPCVAEIVFVDDGSTDQTAERLRTYCDAQDDRYTLIRIENSGPGGARNAGFAVTRGRYVWFVDADDEVVLDAVVAHADAIVAADAAIVDFDIERDGVAIASGPFGPGLHTDDTTVGFRSDLIAHFGDTCCKLLSRTMLIEHDVRYPERTFYEDNPVCVLIACVADSVLKIPDVAYRHHQEHASIMRGPITPRYFDRLLSAAMIIAMIEARGFDDALACEAVREFDRLFYGTTVSTLMGRAPILLLPILPGMLAWRRELLGTRRRPAFMIEMPTVGRRRLLKQAIGFLLWCVAMPASYLVADPERGFRARHERAWAETWVR